MSDRAPLPDRRRHAWRDDLADACLRGIVEVPRYVEGRPLVVNVPLLRCHSRPSRDAPIDTEFLYGEPLQELEAADGWSWVQSQRDGYVGYVDGSSLRPPEPDVAATHRVAVPLALVFPSPSIKVPPGPSLPFGSILHVQATEVVGTERFHRTAVGHILAQHLAPIDRPADDWVAVARTFVGAPYLFGGKTWDGIDCSALVQLALQAAGRDAPRDSDMQAAELGTLMDADPGALRRGDLVFWPGHVGIMLDEARLLHANGHRMMVAIEPLAQTMERLEHKLGLTPTAFRRP
ncbi:C40 family peptidase [Acuticoccus sp.]|uniref:C40 family peptidase n=1 Tax=Acuticoccus sp. TaxID=1904378 RepID=UPI003B51C2E1